MSLLHGNYAAKWFSGNDIMAKACRNDYIDVKKKLIKLRKTKEMLKS